MDSELHCLAAEIVCDRLQAPLRTVISTSKFLCPQHCPQHCPPGLPQSRAAALQPLHVAYAAGCIVMIWTAVYSWQAERPTKCWRSPVDRAKQVKDAALPSRGAPLLSGPTSTAGRPAECTTKCRHSALDRAFSSRSPPQAAVPSTSLQYCWKCSSGSASSSESCTAPQQVCTCCRLHCWKGLRLCAGRVVPAQLVIRCLQLSRAPGCPNSQPWQPVWTL